MTRKPTDEEMTVKNPERSEAARKKAEKVLRQDAERFQEDACKSNRIQVSGIDIAWNPERGTCTFETLPVAMMWVDTTLAGLMAGVQAMVGTERFALALQSEGRKSVETDWQVITQFPDFREGFKAIANIAGVAGWGGWVLSSLDEEKKECRFRVRDSWEGLYQKALGVCWGSAMLAGKMAGYCTKLFGANCWAEQTAFIAKGEPCDEFLVKPSPRSIEKEIEELLASDEATRADMAVALQKLKKEISERTRAEETQKESRQFLNAVFAAVEAGILLIDPSTHTIVKANPKAAKLCGTTPLAMEGRVCHEFVCPAAKGKCPVTALGQTIDHSERVLLARDMKEVPILKTVVSVTIDSRHYLLESFIDITERKGEEEKLKNSLSLLEATLESTADGILVADGKGRMMRFNRRFVEMWRLPAEIVASGDDDAALSFVLAQLKEPEVFVGKVRELYHSPEEFSFDVLRFKDGRVFERYSQPQKMGDSVIGRVWSFRDVSERNRAEEALRESEEKYRSLFENAVEGILIAQGDRIRFANPALQKLFGWSSGVLASKPFIEFIHPDDREMVLQRHMRRMAGEDVDTGYEFRVITGAGEEKWVEINSSRTLWEGKPSNLSFLMDITERKQVEKVLRESEEKYRVLVENAGEAIFVAQEGMLKFVNTRTTDMIGFTSKELKSRPFIEFIHPEDREVVLERHVKRQEGMEVPSQYSFRVTTRTGDSRWVELTAVRIEWEGKPAILNFLSDITERKRAEQEKEKLRSQLLQAQKMESVGRLAGGVAHDFNNMLQAILGHSEMASMTLEEGHPVQRHVRQIQSAAQRSAAVVSQLLAFARKQAVSPKALDLNDTVPAMLKMLRRLIGEDIDLAWRPGHQVRKVMIDPSQVDQILVNLVVNARDAIAGVGEIVIETRNMLLDEAYCAEHPECVPGEYVQLAVSDNGAGMSKEVLDQLFEPFFTTKEPGKGTGLGLSTIYGVVKQNNGCIAVQSEPGKGASFRVYLPALELEALEKTERGQSQALQGGMETILLVEDEETIRDATHALLERLGYRVLSAKTPNGALRLVAEHPGDIDLLITDVVMPEMNGLDLAGRLSGLRPGVKTLFMSGYTADVIAHHGVLDKGVNFIQKPFSLVALAAKVREVLDKGRNAGEVDTP